MFFHQPLGRPVRIASVGFVPTTDIEVICRAVDSATAGMNLDLVVMPETMRGMDCPETLSGPTVTALSEQARSHGVYIVCPIDRLEGRRRWNSTVLLDRSGEVACIYDKVHPFFDEAELRPPREAGAQAVVFDADFGRIGFATCFDVNFPELWQELAKLGAELVVFPSAYSGGRSLQAHAINHNYYVVSATQVGDCTAYDITGARILYEKSKGVHVSRLTLDLDRCIFHVDFNEKPRERLLAKHRGRLAHDVYEEEGWFVLRATGPGVSARALANEFGLEELPHYKARIRQEALATVARSSLQER